MWFWKLAALGFAGVLDLAAGMFIVHVSSEYIAHPLLWWQYAVGAFLGASPDIDLFYAYFKKNQSGHHEYVTHRPIIGIPLAITLGFLSGGTFWAVAAGIGVLWHYLHDTHGFLFLSGGGIVWCWPFSKKYWGVSNFRLVSETVEANLKKDETAFGNIYEGYLTPTRRSITEFALAGTLFGYVIGDLFGVHSGVAAAYLFVVSIIGLWLVYHCRTARL